MAAPTLNPLGVSADTLATLTTNAAKLGAALDSAFGKAAIQGKGFDATLKSVEKSIVAIMSKAAGQQLEKSFATFFGGAGQGSVADTQSATLIPFAAGGIVTTPTLFPQQSGTALTGEAGPEAVLPLQRGPDGKLGLAAAQAPTIHVTIQTQDLDSFRRSEAQMAASLTRALQRGRRAL